MSLGGLYQHADDRHAKVVVDGQLSASQNPTSSEAFADVLLEKLA